MSSVMPKRTHARFDFDANPAASELSLAASSEIEAMRQGGVAQEIIAVVERNMRTIVELMSSCEAERMKIVSAAALSETDKALQLRRLAVDTHAKMVAVVEALRYDNRAAQLESELFKAGEDSKAGDAVLEFLKQQEIRQFLRGRDPEFAENAYRVAIASGDGLMARAIENDPMAQLVPAETLRAVRQQRAELAHPAAAKKLSDIRWAQSAMRALIPALPAGS